MKKFSGSPKRRENPGVQRHPTCALCFHNWRRMIAARSLCLKVGKDRRTFDQACPLLLAAPGRGPSDSATVWEHGPADRLAAFARRVDEPQTGAEFGGERGRGRKSVRITGRKRVSFEFWDAAEKQNRPVPWPMEAPALKSRLDLEFRGARVYITCRAKTENGNSGANFPVDTPARSGTYAPG